MIVLRTTSLVPRFLLVLVGLVLGSQVGNASARPPERSVWDGVYSEEQATRGEALYQAECGSCHGPLLDGGEMAPPLAGAGFAANWDGLPVSDLADRIRTSMPLNTPGNLSRQESADIVAYMLKHSGFPAGSSELSEEASDGMQGILFKASKP